MNLRGKLLAVRTNGGRALADIALQSGVTRSRVELLMPYGLSALPGPGADVLVLSIANSRDHLVALMADDPALRVLGLGAQEVGIQDARGQKVVFRGDGLEISGALKVTIVSAGEVVVQAPSVTVTSPAIKLGSPGASVPDALCAEVLARRIFFQATLPTWKTFGLGWSRRLAALPYQSVEMA
jgi:phage gp45-like